MVLKDAENIVVPLDSIYDNPDKTDAPVIAIMNVKNSDDDNETFALKI